MADGHSYERRAIERWLTANTTSPMTGAVLSNTDVVPNHALRNSILEHFQAADRQLSPLRPQTPVVNEQPTEHSEPGDAERSLQEAAQQLQSLGEYVSTAGYTNDPEDEIGRLFEQLDRDGNGTLNQTELWHLARQLGSKMTEQDIERAMVEMDPDKNGLVDLDEFRAWWLQESEGLPEPEPEPEQEPEPESEPESDPDLAAKSFVGELPTGIIIEEGRPGTVHSSASPRGNPSSRSAVSRMSMLSGVLSDMESEVKELDWPVFQSAWGSLTSGVVFFEESAEVKEIVALYLRKMNCPPLGTMQTQGIQQMFDDWMNNTRMSGAAGVSVSKAFAMLDAGAKV
eukprot:COSAG02_NODE_176_length_31159_cov_30.469833_13_plen_342_part_00